MKLRVDSARELHSQCDGTVRVSAPVSIDAQQVAEFCRLSGDHQAIHDSAQVRNAVIPGNLLIALLPRLVQSLLEVRRMERCMTGAYHNIRFRNPLYVGEAVALSLVIEKVAVRNGKVFVEMDCALNCGEREVLRAQLVDVYFE